MKLFEFRANTRSLADKISGTVPANTSVVFRRTKKGHAAHFSSTADLDSFGIVEGVKTIAMVLKPTANTKLLQDNGADKLEIAVGNISGTGLTECTVNTIDTDAVSNNIWSLVIAEFGAGIDFSTDLEMDVTADVDIVSIVCHDEILSGLQKGNLWEEFRHLSPVSVPNIIRHKIAVDPTGSVLCHNYQNWRGGIVPDLSGNLNDGTSHGFVDASIDGARFNGIDSYIQSSNTGMTDTDYFIEMLIRPHDVTTNQYVCGHGGDIRVLILGFQNGYFNYYSTPSGGYPTGVAADTQIPAYLDKWQYLVMGTDGTKVYGYFNGVKVVEEIGMWVATGGLLLRLGCSVAGLALTNMDVKFMKIHNSVLSEETVKNNWNEIARLCDLNVMGSNLLPDNRIVTAGGYIDG